MRLARSTLPCLWLLALPLLLFAEALQPRRVLAANDWLLTNTYFAHRAPPGFAGPSNPNLYDQVFQFAPWRFAAWNAMRRGEIPLWNPDSYCGTPLLATMQAAVLYPIHWLVLPLPFEATLLASALLRLWIAGFGAYCLGRRHRLSRSGSALAGTSFMLSGYLVVWVGHPHTNVAVFLPWLVLAAEHVLDATSLEKRILACSALATAVGLQFTGGHIESSVDVLFSLGLYCLVRSWLAAEGPAGTRLRLAVGRSVVWPGIGVGLGVLLASAQLLPFLEWLAVSNEAQLRGGGFTPWSWEFLRQIVSLPLVAFPNVFGNPTWKGSASPAFLVGNYNERILYVGVVPLVLAVAAWLDLSKGNGDPARRSWVSAWTVVGAVALARSLRLPVVLWLDQLPLLGFIDPARNRLIVAFALCLVGAAGYERLREDLAAGARVARVRWLGVPIALAAAGGGAALLASSQRLDLYAPPAALGALAALLAAADLRPGARWRRHLVGLSILGLTGADLLVFGRGFNTVTHEALFYPEHAGTEALRGSGGPFRTTALDWALFPDAHLPLGLSDVRGMDYPTRWYSRYIDLTGDRAASDVSYGVMLASVRSPLTRVLNLRYVLASGASLPSSRDLRWRPLDDRLWMAELEPAQPRSFLAFDAVQARDDAHAAELLGAAPERVYERVVLSDAPGAPPLASPRGAKRPPDARVALVRYEREEAAWDVTAEAPGYLVTTDSFYPGWNAYLDGVRAPLIRANLAFRAVYVPAGHHRVEHRYESRSFRWGVGLTAATSAALAALSCAGLVGTRRARHRPRGAVA